MEQYDPRDFNFYYYLCKSKEFSYGTFYNFIT